MVEKEIVFEEQIIVCFGGPPFSGKDKHGELLAGYIQENTSLARTLYYDNGQGLRNTSKDRRFTKHMKNILDKSINTEGKTVPAMVTIRGMTEFLFNSNDGNTHFILKGVFRNPEESSLFVDFANEYFQNVPRYFIRLNISEDIIWNRFNEKKRPGRNDDKKDKLKNRIRAYRNTDDIYDEIEDNTDFIFINIDVNRPIQDVQEDIRLRLSFYNNEELFKSSPFCV